MTDQNQVKQDVRRFYDDVGWHKVEGGVYQNAAYEDLRPVSSDYIHDCHMRVQRHLPKTGKLLLDAGSGPIQYSEYVEYSKGYEKRVCADISITALIEARNRIGEHGLFVVADVARLPFKPESFDGIVSLHTIHHLPKEEHILAYKGLVRVLKTGAVAVLVNGWNNPPITWFIEIPLRIRKNLRRLRRKLAGQEVMPKKTLASEKGTGTFVRKYNAAWLIKEWDDYMPLQVLVWRSISVKAMRFYIHEKLGGRTFLKWLYALEERFPNFFGKNGQYPLVVIDKK